MARGNITTSVGRNPIAGQRQATIPALPIGTYATARFGYGKTYTVTATFPDGRACSARFAYGTSADEVEAKWQRAVAKAPPSTALTAPDYAAPRRDAQAIATEAAKALRKAGIKANARKGVVRVTAKGKSK